MSKFEVISPEGRVFNWSWVIALSLASFITSALVTGDFFSGSLSKGFTWLGYLIGGALGLANISLTTLAVVSACRRHFLKAVALSVIAVPLMVASIAMSVTFMSDTTDAMISEKVSAAQSSSLISQQINTIDEQIEGQRASIASLRAQFDSNTQANYRQMNLELSEFIQESEQQLATLIGKRSELIAKAEASAPVKAEITVYGMDKSTVDLIILLVAILVDVTAVAGSSYLINDRIERREVNALKAEEEKKDRIRSSLLTPKTPARPAPAIPVAEARVEPKTQCEPVGAVSEPVQPSVEIKSGDEEIVDIAIDLIFNRGIKPKVKEIWEHGKPFGMSNKKAKKALGILFDRGIIEKNESGHFVIADSTGQMLSA